VAQDQVRLSPLQQGVGLRQDRAHPGVPDRPVAGWAAGCLRCLEREGGGEGHQQGATAEWTLVLGGRCLLGGPDPRYIKHIIETPRYGIIYMVVCVCV
jgi:hypothetical protein